VKENDLRFYKPIEFKMKKMKILVQPEKAIGERRRRNQREKRGKQTLKLLFLIVMIHKMTKLLFRFSIHRIS